MKDLETVARREARLIREEATSIADTDGAWQAVLGAEPAATPLEATRRARRRFPTRALVAVAAGVVVMVAAAATVTWLRDADPAVVQSPTAVTGADTVPPSTTVAPSTTPPPTAPSSTVSPPVTVAPAGLTVRADAPPPLLTPAVFVELERDADESPPSVAVAEGGIVAAIDDGATLAVVGWDGSRRDVPLSEPVALLLAAGPGDVAYGITQGPAAMDMSVNAYALSGARAGQIVARTPVDPNRFVELPSAAIGHGPTGLIDRVRAPGEAVAPYVDASGAPITWPEAPPLVTIDDTDTVRSASGAVWPLVIERDPTSPTEYAGPNAPAPAAGGGATYWTAVGPPERPDVDFPEPTVRVVATLHPDGTAEWQQLPPGWDVVASDVHGTVLGSVSEAGMQLARLTPADSNDPDPAPAAPTAASASGTPTPPSAPGTCDPDDHNGAQALPLRRCDLGFGVVWVRNALVARGLLDGGSDAASPAEFTVALEEAVRRFQQASGLEVDGLVGSRTWFALYPEYLDIGPELVPFDDDGNGRIEPAEVRAMGDANSVCDVPTAPDCPTPAG